MERSMALEIDLDVESILGTFAAECEERITEIEQCAVALESEQPDPNLLETIFRNAHTIKGNAASLGMTPLAEFTHVLENLLQRLCAGGLPVTREIVTLLLQSVDALREILTGGAAYGQLSADHATLIVKLAEYDGPDPKRLSTIAVEPVEASTRARRGREDLRTEGHDGTIRVAISKLDGMLNLAGEIAIAQGRLRQALEDKTAICKDALEAESQLERLSLDLQEQIMKVRMVPVGPIFRRYARMVREIAAAAGKRVRLAIEGEDAEIDLSVVEHLKDPLTHMIRNAIDHGIEAPETRLREGKDPCGLLLLKAFHESGSIIIQLNDDGAGLSRERIIARAKARGFAADVEKLPSHLLYRLIFEPGFSTAASVTNLSGRGIGMDVVRRNIEALRGSVTVDSESGKGTKIKIRLPLTLAIIDGFAVGVGDDIFILPLHSVLECLTLPSEQSANNSGEGIINLRGEPLPYMRLREWLGRREPAPARENVVVVVAEQIRAGFAVDALFGPRQTVIKPLGKQLQNLPGIAGSAILGNGRVALILDVPGLLRDVIGTAATLASQTLKAV
jgi:two-component system chemotaxis sensor kinase CheA